MEIKNNKPKTAFSPICHCERPTRALQEDPFCTKLKFQQKEAWQSSQSAFSLIEMLMALLVASLLLAALAPVMTRRMADHELKVMSEASNYEKDMVVSVFTKDTNFNIPSDANQVRITMMGGGGKGGDALYGNKVFTSNETFTIPDGVTKLRVFMIGGGGGGASGGKEERTIKNSTTDSKGQQLYNSGTGVYTWNIPSSTVGNVPAVDERCIATGVTDWTITPEPTKTVAAGKTLVHLWACGGGGGGGGSFGGGSGGLVHKYLPISPSTTSISVTVGGGGGKGGTDSSSAATSTANAAAGYNGGGGGCEAVPGNPNSVCYGAGNNLGGRGGKVPADCGSDSYLVSAANGSGNPGGGYGGNGRAGQGAWNCAFIYAGYGSLQGGGGGGGAAHTGGGGGGGGATFFGRYGNSADSEFFLVAPGGGGGSGYYNVSYGFGAGGGGGGAGGGDGSSWNNLGGKGGNGGNNASGSVGGASPIENADYCAGGNAGANGKNGYIAIYWGLKDVLQCTYKDAANSGAGGGSGQIWIGEIDVTPGQTVSFNVGVGGSKTTSYSSNGNDGTSTSIIVNGRTYSVSGGRGGKYESDDTYILTSGGLGGGIKKESLGAGSKYVNWLNLNENIILSMNNDNNKNGGHGNTVSNGAGGGKGGSSFNMQGTMLNGGTGGGVQSNGIDAAPDNYGAGGGGGGGVINYGGTPGLGGKGANGYIYIEWGGSNASGGTMGEFVQKTITNLDPDPKNRTMKIRIGRGGGITSASAEDDPELFTSSVIGSNGNGGETSIGIISGNKTVTHKARGGLKGNNGGSESGDHGEDKLYPDNYSDLYKEYVTGNMNIITGQKGEDNYGGMGGYLSCLYQTKDEEGNSICASTIKSNDGNNITLGPIRPGCGGTSILSPLYDSICNISNQTPSPHGNNGLYGAGGGGGAVLNQTGGIGGNGGNGFVILEYKSTTLD